MESSAIFSGVRMSAAPLAAAMRSIRCAGTAVSTGTYARPDLMTPR